MELHGDSAQEVISRLGLCYLIGSRIDKRLATTCTLRAIRCTTAKKRYLINVPFSLSVESFAFDKNNSIIELWSN